MTVAVDMMESESATAPKAAENNTEEEAYAAEKAGEETGPDDTDSYTDYSEVASRDIEEIHTLFPESRHIQTIHSLDNPERFAELRDLGLSATEAYLATQSPRRTRDNRSHLVGSVPRGASGPSVSMSISELDNMRDVFGTLSDSEIQSLYKRVMR